MRVGTLAEPHNDTYFTELRKYNRKIAYTPGLLAAGDIIELGAVINGTHPGRSSDEEITVFDGTGVGLQDLAVASAAVELALKKGLAIEVEF